MKSTVVDESLSSFKPMYCSREYQASTRLIQQYEKSTLKDNHEYPIRIPRQPCVLLKGSVLCNCDIHAEDHSLLESIAACPGKQSAMTIYYTVNAAFIHYLDSFKEKLEVPSLDVNQNWTTQEQVLPISLQSTPFYNKLLKAPETLKGLVQQYKH